jgi:hypothetical protein
LERRELEGDDSGLEDRMAGEWPGDFEEDNPEPRPVKFTIDLSCCLSCTEDADRVENGRECENGT